MAKTAAILGLDTADGAYLARLLLARGYRLSGTGGADKLARLGIAGDVVRAGSVETLVAAARPDEVYDLRRDPSAAAVEMTGNVRVFVAAPPGAAAAAGPGGRFVAVGRVFGHESRLGPGTSFVARIIAAAADGTDPAPADLAAVTDCGWTPEYVDAMWRMLQRAEPAGFDIATGRSLGGNEVAHHAFSYFGRDAAPFAAATPAGSAVGDAAATRADLGWSATTWGRDLVRTLCEGVAEERRR